ncbi:hypothetical protein ACFV3I_13595 [Microbacterium sp. NPDC059771]|uniref:hypothetical protein n=1 Tax=Microbacterium sp. NPDC059771 TaxID=3346941 RepID=UPI00365F799B
MPSPTPEDLHAQADALWRSTNPADPSADSFAQAVELVLTGRTGAPRRVANWVQALHRYEGHWGENERSPRENTRARDTLPADERRLGEWARYQRRFADQLNGYQHARLDVSPAFEWDPLETLWQTRFMACATFVRINRRLPRLHADDRAEFLLARWLGRQLHRLQTGRLEQTRADDLHRLLRISRRL